MAILRFIFPNTRSRTSPSVSSYVVSKLVIFMPDLVFVWPSGPFANRSPKPQVCETCKSSERIVSLATLSCFSCFLNARHQTKQWTAGPTFLRLPFDISTWPSTLFTMQLSISCLVKVDPEGMYSGVFWGQASKLKGMWMLGGRARPDRTHLQRTHSSTENDDLLTRFAI